MSYNYLQICNEVLEEVNEVEFTDSTDFASSVGFHSKVKNYVNYAIARIYDEEDGCWPFLLVTTTFTTLTDGTVDYTPVAATSAPVEAIEWDSFCILKDSLLNNPDYLKLAYVSWPPYRDIYRVIDKNMDSNGYGKPRVVTRQLDNTISISPPAAELYTVQYQYYTGFLPLSAYSDVPLVPERYKQIIIDGALKRVYEFRDNAEQAMAKEQDFKDGVNRMRRKIIPQSESATVIY